MHFAQKIYYNNKPFILTNDSRAAISADQRTAGYPVFRGATRGNFGEVFAYLDRQGTRGCFVEDASEEALWQQVHHLYEPMDAGGGVVTNENGEVLMIYRRGKWDLPKGKKDEGEDIAACSLREVQEETGLQKITLGDKIGDTYHVYSQYNQNLLKRTAWYHMKASKTEPLHPQSEENILEARWIAEKDLAPLLQKTYEAIVEVLQAAGLKWEQRG